MTVREKKVGGKKVGGASSPRRIQAGADVSPKLSVPMAKPPSQSEFHVHATLLEVSDAFRLKVLSENPRIGPHLLAFLSSTTALVDPDGVDDLIKALRAEGDPPRIVTDRNRS